MNGVATSFHLVPKHLCRKVLQTLDRFWIFSVTLSWKHTGPAISIMGPISDVRDFVIGMSG